MSARQQLRTVARHGVLDVRSTLDLMSRADRALARPRVHFVYLHSVPPTDLPRFRRLLNNLAKTHEFVGYGAAVSRVLGGHSRQRPAMAFSFDDGFASNLQTARALEEHGVSACFFVPPPFLGTQTVSEARRFFRTHIDVDEPAMSWEDLEVLLASGHEVGNHTMTHRNLATLTVSELEDEIEGGRQMLDARLGIADPHFAWPFGRLHHFSPAAADVVFRSGHRSCASAQRGAHVGDSPRRREDLCVRRDHLIAKWPRRHICHFLAHSSATATQDSDLWPKDRSHNA